MIKDSQKQLRSMNNTLKRGQDCDGSYIDLLRICEGNVGRLENIVKNECGGSLLGKASDDQSNSEKGLEMLDGMSYFIIILYTKNFAF